jgi:tRNA-specific 2-thiouridylase
VDSALAAALLKERGWDVYAVHLLLSPSPYGLEDRNLSVERIADHLRIPLHIVDARDQFEERVIEPFLDGYLSGLTPNPCVVCNPEVKFDILLRWADEHGVAFVATGHYAGVRPTDRREWALCRGKDRQKEQSYFLHRLAQRVLGRCLFPLDGLCKQETLEQAEARRLPCVAAPESQEICFIPEGDYRAFLDTRRDRAAAEDGDIVDASGKKLGEHGGTFRYTIGQRRGLGIASERPYYVVTLRPEQNQVVVGRREDLFCGVAVARDFFWSSGISDSGTFRAEAQVRYRHKPAPGRLHVLSPDRVRFEFDEPQPAVTPGQALVCYDGERVIGGGWIE